MAELCQVLVLMAIPVVILLTLRFFIVRQARLEAIAATGTQSAVRRA